MNDFLNSHYPIKKKIIICSAGSTCTIYKDLRRQPCCLTKNGIIETDKAMFLKAKIKKNHTENDLAVQVSHFF